MQQIFLDMDGVLCDWTGAACRLFGRDPNKVTATWGEQYDICPELGITTNELWRAVDAAGADFWADLEPLPWAQELYTLCMSYGPVSILTSPSRHPSSHVGKLAWLERHLPQALGAYLMGRNKAACSHPGAVLIDDTEKNIKAWEARGGFGVLFPAPWNEWRAAFKIPEAGPRTVMGLVRHRLEEY